MNEESENVIEDSSVPVSTRMIMLEDIAEIEQHFKRGTLAYTECINRFDVEIEKLKSLMVSIKESKEIDEQSFLALLSEIAYDEKVLTELNEQFIYKVNSLEELFTEYKALLKKNDYEKVHQKKIHEVDVIQDKIEILELTLLSRERLYQNLLQKLDPKRKEIENLQTDLKVIELEKSHFESIKLEQVALIEKHNEELLPDEIVETGDIKEK